MLLTFDWNCLIELDRSGPQAASVRQLVAAHRSGKIEVGLLAASASENARSRRFPGSALLFKQQVEKLGLQDIPIIPMPAIMDLSYFDYAYWVEDGEAFQEKFDSLWEIISPHIPRKHADFLGLAPDEVTSEMFQSRALAKWRNAWCDVMSAYCHIHEGREVFVTLNTKDFQARADALADVGMDRIAEPRKAVESFGL